MILKCKKYRLKIKALGMRGIKSLGVLPIRRPYIIFGMKNILQMHDNKDQKIESKDIIT